MNFELQANHVPSIQGDENRLKQVLINVLDNAFKFTPSGGVVTIGTNTENHLVKITIEDTGTGIPVEDIEKVTEKFFKGPLEGTGSGLGLSISNEIIKLHKGLLNIRSSDRGTTVEIQLPC